MSTQRSRLPVAVLRGMTTTLRITSWTRRRLKYGRLNPDTELLTRVDRTHQWVSSQKQAFDRKIALGYEVFEGHLRSHTYIKRVRADRTAARARRLQEIISAERLKLTGGRASSDLTGDFGGVETIRLLVEIAVDGGVEYNELEPNRSILADSITKMAARTLQSVGFACAGPDAEHYDCTMLIEAEATALSGFYTTGFEHLQFSSPFPPKRQPQGKWLTTGARIRGNVYFCRSDTSYKVEFAGTTEAPESIAAGLSASQKVEPPFGATFHKAILGPLAAALRDLWGHSAH